MKSCTHNPSIWVCGYFNTPPFPSKCSLPPLGSQTSTNPSQNGRTSFSVEYVMLFSATLLVISCLAAFIVNLPQFCERILQWVNIRISTTRRFYRLTLFSEYLDFIQAAHVHCIRDFSLPTISSTSYGWDSGLLLPSCQCPLSFLFLFPGWAMSIEFDARRLAVINS